jgi:hypothetical protein
MLRAYQAQVEIVSDDCIETYGGARRLHDRIPHHQGPNRGIRTRGAAGAIHASRAATTAGAALAALSLSPETAEKSGDLRDPRDPSRSKPIYGLLGLHRGIFDVRISATDAFFRSLA